MRVLHVINGLTTGGAEAVLYRLVTYPSAVEHRVVCLDGRAWYSEKLERHGITVTHLDWGSRGAASAIRALGRIIATSDADVIQAWMYRANILAGLAGKAAGVPVVWNIRSSSLRPLRLPSRLLGYAGGMLARRLATFVINCGERAREVHAKLGYDAAPGIVIPNGYDARLFHPDQQARSRTRKQLGVADGTFLIGSIGRWDNLKGYPLFLQALKRLRARRMHVSAMLVGRGLDEDNGELSAMIERHDLREGIQLLGERSDISDISRALDLHVLPSISEGFPNVVAETMLSGTVNVVTDVGDAAFIVGDAGWVVPAGNPDALVNAMEQAYCEWSSRTPDWRIRGVAARERIATNFSLERMVLAYERVWRRIAKARN